MEQKYLEVDWVSCNWRDLQTKSWYDKFKSITEMDGNKFVYSTGFGHELDFPAYPFFPFLRNTTQHKYVL